MNNEMTILNGFSTSIGGETQRMTTSIGASLSAARELMASILRRKAKTESAVAEAIAGWYGGMLGQTVTARQAVAMVKAQAAFFLLIMPLELGLLFRTAALGWFAYSLLQCSRRMEE